MVSLLKKYISGLVQSNLSPKLHVLCTRPDVFIINEHAKNLNLLLVFTLFSTSFLTTKCAVEERQLVHQSLDTSLPVVCTL